MHNTIQELTPHKIFKFACNILKHFYNNLKVFLKEKNLMEIMFTDTFGDLDEGYSHPLLDNLMHRISITYIKSI